MSIIRQSLTQLVELFYPNLCFACQQSHAAPKSAMCIRCEFHIVPTQYHTMEDNPVMERFAGRVQLAHATTCFEFTKGGLLQQLIHQLKYKNEPQVGVELGRIFGRMLKETAPYDTVDYIIPVPLHPKKQHKRGYNQAAMIAQGLAEGMQKEWSEKYLIRNTNTATQTKKSRLDRFANVQNAFDVVQAEALEGKHLLLVDDVITTGATLEACASKLLAAAQCRVSLGAIALASN